MKLATFSPSSGVTRIGIVHSGDGRVFDLTAAAARAAGDQSAFSDMLALMSAGSRALDSAYELLARYGGDPEINHAIGSVALLSPLPVPSSIRDFVSFPGHILNAPAGLRTLATTIGVPLAAAPNASAAAEIPEVYRRQPNYYKGNRFTVVGHDAEVRRPRDSGYLDYELEFGVFIGTPGMNVPRARAMDHVFGYSIFNDFSARDIQVREMGGMTGPGKSKDFDTGNAIGPWIVTADDIKDPYALKMTSRVNGETWCSGKSSGMVHTFADMIAYVSRDEPLHPGEFFGSGTVGGGTGMEISRYLQDGDVIELEVEGLGILRNRVVGTPVAQ